MSGNTDRKMEPWMLRDLAELCALGNRVVTLTANGETTRFYPNKDLSYVLLEEAARREAKAKPQKRCDRLNPPVCLHPEACVTECAFNKPATACATTGEREGPGSAAADDPQIINEAGTIEPEVWNRLAVVGPGSAAGNCCNYPHCGCSSRAECSVKRSAVPDERVFRYDTGGGYIASMTAPHVEKHFADLQARINALEADKAELVAALEMFNGPITHATFERARMILAKHGGA